MEGIILAVAIIFPFLAGFICLGLKNSRARATLILFTSIVLIALSILFLRHGAFHYTPPAVWDMVILVLDYVLLAYFLYIGIADFISIGINIRNVFTIGLVLIQGIFLALFEFSWAPHVPVEVEPIFFVDQLSIIMRLIICIFGSLICIYGIKYMEDHERHLGLERTKQPRFFFYMIMFLGAMNGLVFANSLLWLCFFWEVTTLCCYALIRHDGTPQAIGCGLQALWMNLIGGAGFVFAIIYAFNSLGTLSLAEIIEAPGVALFGGFTFMTTAILAISQTEAKRVLAYSLLVTWA